MPAAVFLPALLQSFLEVHWEEGMGIAQLSSICWLGLQTALMPQRPKHPMPEPTSLQPMGLKEPVPALDVIRESTSASR